MKCRLTLLVILTMLVTIPAYAGSVDTMRPEDVGMSTDILQRLDYKLQQLVDDEAAAGFQVLIARRGSRCVYS